MNTHPFNTHLHISHVSFDIHKARHVAFKLYDFPEIKTILLKSLDLLNAEKRLSLFDEASKTTVDLDPSRLPFTQWFELSSALMMILGRVGHRGLDQIIAKELTFFSMKSQLSSSLALMINWCGSLLRLPQGDHATEDQAATLLGNLFRLPPDEMAKPIQIIAEFWDCLLPFHDEQVQHVCCQTILYTSDILSVDPKERLLLWLGSLSFEPWACPQTQLTSSILNQAKHLGPQPMPDQADRFFRLGSIQPEFQSYDIGRIWHLDDQGVSMSLLQIAGRQILGAGHFFTWGLYFSLCRMDLVPYAIQLGISPCWDESLKILLLALNPVKLSLALDPLDDDVAQVCLQAVAHCESQMIDSSTQSSKDDLSKSRSL